MNTLLLNYGKCILTILKCRLAPWFLTNLKRNAWSNQFKRQHHFRWQRIRQRGWGLGSRHFWGWDRATPQTMEEQIPSEVPGASGPNSPASLLLPTPFCSRQWGGACTNEVSGGPPTLPPPHFPCTPFNWDDTGKWVCGTQTIRSHIYF